MKTIKQHFLYIVLLGILLTMAYCYQQCHHFEEVSSIRSPLINNFKSYMGIEEAKQMLPSHQKNWVVIEDYSLSVIKRHPPFHIYSVAVEDYKHLNHLGQLGLIFYNKRLAITSFYPSQIKSYIKALEETEGLKITLDKVSSYNTSIDRNRIIIKPYTYVWITSPLLDIYYQIRNIKHKKTVMWQDLRLLKEEQKWKNCYSDD